MKVLISTDMEGISGVVDFSQTRVGGGEYERARRYFTHDVNAAVQGCVDGGASEIVVTDSHAFQLNVLYEDLHPEAELVIGAKTSHRANLVLETLDNSFDLIFLLGIHAGAHLGGVIAHTYLLPATFWEVRINGTAVGETEIATALAGASGVPLGLLTGDDVTVGAAIKLFPEIETVITKRAIGRTAARCLSLSKTGHLIEAASKRAVERRKQGEFTPWTFKPPLTLEIICGHSGVADKLAFCPGATRIGERQVALETDSYQALYHGLITFCYLGTLAMDPPP